MLDSFVLIVIDKALIKKLGFGAVFLFVNLPKASHPMLQALALLRSWGASYPAPNGSQEVGKRPRRPFTTSIKREPGPCLTHSLSLAHT